MQVTVYTYFNVQQVATLMDSVAALTASPGFLGALRLLAMIGFVVFVAGVALGKNQDPLSFFRWFLTLAVINSLLLVPKADVVLVDRTGGLALAARKNVPLGLAFFASVTSTVGDSLTRAFETVFSLPDDIAFQKAGVMFGNTVVLDSLRTTPETPALRQDLTEFINSCTYYDVLEGRISQEALVNSEDLWATMKNTSLARLTKLSTASSGSASCDDAYTSINSRIPTEIPRVLEARGRLLNPSAPTNAAASSKYQVQLVNSYSYLAAVAKSATEIVRQGMMTASMRESQLVSAQRLDAASNAIVSNAAAQAEVMANNNYLAMARVAERAAPALRNMIEVLCYAVFPLLVLLMVVAGDGAAQFLKGYVMCLVWVQLIPPLYAVLNFVMSSVSKVSLTGVIASSSASGTTLRNVADLSQNGLSDMAMAGYLTILVPLVAWALVKGGEIGGSALFSSLLGPAQSATSQATGQLSNGNLTQGGVSLDNTSMNTTTAHKLDTAPAVSTGFERHTNALGTTTFGPGGVVRHQANQSSLPYSANFGHKIANSMSAEASRRQETYHRESEAASTARTAALVERMGIVSSFATQRGSSGGSEIASGGRSSAAVTEMVQLAESVNQRLGHTANSSVGRALVSEVALAASMGADVGAAVGRFLKVSAGGSVVFKNGTTTTVAQQQALEAAASFAMDRLKSKNVTADQALTDDFRTSSAFQWAKSNRSESVKGEEAAMTSATTHARNAEKAKSDSLAMTQQARVIRDSWAHSSIDYTNYIAAQLSRNGQLQAFNILSQTDPDRAAAMAAPYALQLAPALGPTQPLEGDISVLQQQAPALAGRTMAAPGLEGRSVSDSTKSAYSSNSRIVKSHGFQQATELDDVTPVVQAARSKAGAAVAGEGGELRTTHEAAAQRTLASVDRLNQVPGIRGPQAGEKPVPNSTPDHLDRARDDIESQRLPPKK